MSATHHHSGNVKTARLEEISVLVVDPDFRIADLLRKVLMSFGFGTVYLARDGSEALRIMRQKNVDIAITDWDMEPMDGISFIRHIRTSEDSPNRLLPVIMLTGKAQKKYVETARDTGMTEFVVKPFSVRTLCDRLMLVIEHPRNFIMSKQYTGPDRRRREQPPGGNERRTEISEGVIIAENPDSKVVRIKDEDVTIVNPNFAIKAKIGDDISLTDVFSPENVRKAQRILKSSQGEFLEWIIEDTRAMEQAYARLEKSEKRTPEEVRSLFQAALTVKSQAGTFGFDLASSVAESLMHMLESRRPIEAPQMRIIRKHIDALYVIFQRNIQGMGGQVGKDLLESLALLAKKYYEK